MRKLLSVKGLIIVAILVIVGWQIYIRTRKSGPVLMGGLLSPPSGWGI